MTPLPIVRNETQGAGNGTSCLVCGAQIQQAATGRPARFCSSAHRIQHHRRRRREAEVTTTSDVPSSPTVNPVSTLQSAAALEDLADMLEQRSTLPGAAALRHLAEEAVGLETLLETIEPAIAASPDHDVASTLQDLCEHRNQLSRMADLDDLADAVTEFNRAVRSARRVREELQWAMAELEADGPHLEGDTM